MSSDTQSPHTVGIPAEFGANEWLVEEMYDQYSTDPASVDPAWVTYFQTNGAPGGDETAIAPAAAPAVTAPAAPVAVAPAPVPAPPVAPAPVAAPPKIGNTTPSERFRTVPYKTLGKGNK